MSAWQGRRELVCSGRKDTMKMTMRALAVLLGTALISCGPTDDEEAPYSTGCVDYQPDPADATLVVGHDVDDAFVPLMPDDTLPMEFGQQGGQHFFIALRLLTDGQDVTVRSTLTVDGQVHGSVASRVEGCDGQWTAVSQVRIVLNSDEAVSGTLNVAVDGDGAPPPVDIPISISSGG